MEYLNRKEECTDPIYRERYKEHLGVVNSESKIASRIDQCTYDSDDPRRQFYGRNGREKRAYRRRVN